MARAARVVLFLIAISLPLAASLAGVDGADPRAEKRELAELPRLDGSLASVLRFPAGFAAWFEDHFAFRSALVRLYGETRFFGLGVSPTASVVKGPNGWLFYATDGGMDDYTREKPFTDTELAEWRDTIVRTHQWLSARGIAYVFVLAPDKHVVYPEELPPTIRPLRAKTRMDQLLEALDGTGVAALDLRPALLEAKARERVFDVTDTHWNPRGAFVAYRQILAAVAAQGAAVPPAWTRADFVPAEREVEGQDLAAMMGLQASLRETQLSLRPLRPRRARVVVPGGAEPDAELGLLVTEIPGSELPRAVVFRDSFFSRVAPFLSEHFSRTVYRWQNNFDSEIVLRERATVVVQEIVGRHLVHVSPYADVAGGGR